MSVECDGEVESEGACDAEEGSAGGQGGAGLDPMPFS